MKDWREDYIICEHVFNDENLEEYRAGFRVCCNECYQKGFLFEDLRKEDKDGLCVGRLIT